MALVPACRMVPPVTPGEAYDLDDGETGRMPIFQEFLTKLSAEYARLEHALADARAELRVRQGHDVGASALASWTPSGGRPSGGVGLQGEHMTKAPRGYSSFASTATGRQESVGEDDEEEEEEKEEQGDMCERGHTWSWAPTPLKERLTMEPVAEEGIGPTVVPVTTASARSRGASAPPALAPVLVGRAPMDRSVALYGHCDDHSTCSSPITRSKGTTESMRTQGISQTYMSVKESPRPSKRSSANAQFTNLRQPQGVTIRIRQDRAQLVPGAGAERAEPRVSGSGSFPLRAYRENATPAMGRRSLRDFRFAKRWVINPEHSATLEHWDHITIVALAFVALVTPVQVSMMEAKFDVMFFVNCVIDFIFFCDMILQFFLMYPQRTDGVYAFEHRHPKIIANYLKTWFAIDILSIVPFDLFAVLSNSEGVKQLKIVKAVRLMRLLKLIRVLKASRIFNRFEIRMSITYGKLALLKFFVILSVITHWLANLWALTLVIVDENEGIPRWVDTLTDLEAKVEIKTKDSPAKLYIACLYFTSYTITSVGYGDIGPKNISERVVLTFMIILSGISWAVVLGQVCGIVANLDKDEQVFRSTMDELNALMQDRLIPGSMRKRLRSFFLSNKTAQKRARHMNIVSAMSPGLRAEVCWEINGFWLDKVSFLRPFLAEAGEHKNTGIVRSLRNFVLDMSLMMEQVVRAQSEVFGAPHTMYILNRGLVARLNRLFRSGSVWGSDFVLSDRRLLEPVESYALTYIEFTTLTRQHFFDLVQRNSSDFPEIYRTVRRYCCWLAFQRALLLEAKRRRGLLRGKTKDTFAPMLSGD